MTGMLTRAQVALAMLCLVLASLLAYETNAAPAAPDVPAARWQSPPAPAQLPIAPPLPPSQSFASIDARPLFNPARTPVASVDPAAKIVVPPPTDVSLIGVIIDGERRLALLRTPASPLEVSVAVGDSVSGWQVATIAPDHVVLHSGTTDFTVNLNSGRPGAAPDGGLQGGATTPGTMPVSPPGAVPDQTATPPSDVKNF